MHPPNTSSLWEHETRGAFHAEDAIERYRPSLAAAYHSRQESAQLMAEQARDSKEKFLTNYYDELAKFKDKEEIARNSLREMRSQQYDMLPEVQQRRLHDHEVRSRSLISRSECHSRNELSNFHRDLKRKLHSSSNTPKSDGLLNPTLFQTNYHQFLQQCDQKGIPIPAILKPEFNNTLSTALKIMDPANCIRTLKSNVNFMRLLEETIQKI